MSFTASLWQSIQPLYQAIIDHPFNQELAQGTLAADRFQFYLKQDALYLVDFAKALGLTGARCIQPERIVDFQNFAIGAIVAERSLHESYFERYGITLDVDYAPGCFTYTNYLLATAALRPLEEAIAALLPCFWIYREVGHHILKTAQPNNPYQNWIETYSGEEFSSAVDRAIAITEDVAAAAPEPLRDQMRAAFVISSRLEWMFWDSAYRLETWAPQISHPS